MTDFLDTAGGGAHAQDPGQWLGLGLGLGDSSLILISSQPCNCKKENSVGGEEKI